MHAAIHIKGGAKPYLLAASVRPKDHACCLMQVSCSTKILRTQPTGASAPRLTLLTRWQHLQPEVIASGLPMVLMTWRSAET